MARADPARSWTPQPGPSASSLQSGTTFLEDGIHGRVLLVTSSTLSTTPRGSGEGGALAPAEQAGRPGSGSAAWVAAHASKRHGKRAAGLGQTGKRGAGLGPRPAGLHSPLWPPRLGLGRTTATLGAIGLVLGEALPPLGAGLEPIGLRLGTPRFRRTASSWARSGRRAYRRSARWANRTRTSVGRNFNRWGRRLRRRGRVAWNRAGQAFARTRSPGAAFRAGASSLAGRGLMGGLGEFNFALTAVTASMKALQAGFEGQNARNRGLAGYSGVIGSAMGQLALGDARRNVALARGTEGSAATLVNLVNKSRDIQVNFDRLNANIANRTASAGAVLWNAAAAPWGEAAAFLTGKIEKADPNGQLLARLAASPFSAAAGVGGYLAGVGRLEPQGRG